MVDSIVNNNPKGWDYGAYTNYIDDKLANCECFSYLRLSAVLCTVVVLLTSCNLGQNLYYASHYPRLRNLKDKYDPHDTFNFPLAIQE